MKKLLEVPMRASILKDYRINKNYTTTILYYFNGTIRVRLYLSEQSCIVKKFFDTKLTLKQIRIELDTMIKEYEDSLKPAPKTELQQIKDILIEKITVDQAEKYNYATVDYDGYMTMWTDKPFSKSPKFQEWATLNMVVNHTCKGLDIWICDLDQLDYCYNNSNALCFKIADLKGQN
jgi:hypothetical protein